MLTQRRVESSMSPNSHVREFGPGAGTVGGDRTLSSPSTSSSSTSSGFWRRLESFKGSAERRLGQNPVVTIAAGLALGVVIGWLLKRR
jgi:hypothetical protein